MRLLATAGPPGTEKGSGLNMYIAKSVNTSADWGKSFGSGYDALKNRLRWRIRRARRAMEERARIQSEPVTTDKLRRGFL
jgi:hypothetical protein